LNKYSYFVLLLNPFLFSSLISLGVDVSIFYLLAIITISIINIPKTLIFISPLALIGVKPFLHVLIFLLIYQYLSKINKKHFLRFVKISINVWLILLVFEIIFPDIHQLLFNRDFIIDASRGFKIFSPEPATTSIFLISVYLMFAESLNNFYKYSLIFLMVLTFNLASFLFIFFILIKLLEKKHSIILVVIFSIILLNYDFGSFRLLNQINNVIDLGVLEILELDRSLSARANSIRALFRMFQFLDFTGFDYSNIYSGTSAFHMPLIIVSGIFSSMNSLGILSVFIFILTLLRVKTLGNYILLLLFIFIGTLGHIFPLLTLLEKKHKNIKTYK
jgi:hypothetical protein